MQKNGVETSLLNIRNIIENQNQEKYIELQFKITNIYRDFVKIQNEWEKYLNNTENNQNDTNLIQIKEEEDQLLIKMDQNGKETIDWEEKEVIYSLEEKKINKQNAILIAIQVLFSLGMISYGIAGKKSFFFQL